MRAAIWARVSTSDRETETRSPSSWVWTERGGFEVVDVYRSRSPCSTARHRPALGRVLDDARAARFSALLVWALDRLERGGLLDIVQRWDRLTRAGV